MLCETGSEFESRHLKGSGGQVTSHFDKVANGEGLIWCT